MSKSQTTPTSARGRTKPPGAAGPEPGGPSAQSVPAEAAPEAPPDSVPEPFAAFDPVPVVDKNGNPLTPTHPARARILLREGRARIYKRFPLFSIQLLGVEVSKEEVQAQLKRAGHSVTIKIDPGSKRSGFAVVLERESEDPGPPGKVVKALFLIVLAHHAAMIVESLKRRRLHRRSRRGRKCRRRPCRIRNRRRGEGRLPPSSTHVVDGIVNLIVKLARILPIAGIAVEINKFDVQLLDDPTISGVGYQRGTLWRTNARAYVLARDGHRCAYCGKKESEGVRLELDHFIPRNPKKGPPGLDNVSNLVACCPECNRRKGNQDPGDFLSGDQKQLRKLVRRLKASYKDAAAVNKIRKVLLSRLEALGLPVVTGTGAQTSRNRLLLGLVKHHAIDALCVGEVSSVTGWNRRVTLIESVGRGHRRMMIPDKHGFPRGSQDPKAVAAHPKDAEVPIGHRPRTKTRFGFRSGDIVEVVVDKDRRKRDGTVTVPKGKYYTRVAANSRRVFDGVVQAANGKAKIGFSHKNARLVQRNDGYRYSWTTIGPAAE